MKYLILVFLVLSAGCGKALTGDPCSIQFDALETKAEVLVMNQSTYADVLAALGQPSVANTVDSPNPVYQIYEDGILQQGKTDTSVFCATLTVHVQGDATQGLDNLIYIDYTTTRVVF